MLKLSITGLMIVMALSLSRGASAGLIDGGFESGFSGWSTTGITSIETAAFGSGPTQGNSQVLMESGNGTGFTTEADLEAFLGLSSGCSRASLRIKF